jgi:hypothetical protein
MKQWFLDRIAHLKGGPRTIERARVHGGHILTCFAWGALVALFGGAWWLAASVILAWIIGVETYDTLKYGGNRFRNILPYRFPLPFLTWSFDSWCDAFQLGLGGSLPVFVLLLGPLPGLAIFVAWLALYLQTLPYQT